MTAEETELFRELLADHASHPRNAVPLTSATGSAEGHNKTCGDQFTLWVKVDDGVIMDIACKGSGCAISMSSGSLMTEAVKGKTIDEARALFERFHSMLTTEESGEAEELGKLAAFANVRRFPIRVKCATLPWHTMQQAIAKR